MTSARSRRRFGALSLMVLLAAALALPARAQQATYLALGDSFAFGITTYADALATGVTFADQGYVRPFADFLATQNGGVRPNVINLSIPGETTASFFAGGSPFTLLNANYVLAPGATQAQLLSARIAAEHAAGRTINDITLQLGGNDLLDLAFTPAFLALSPAGQLAQVSALLPAVQASYAGILSLIQTQAPEARLFAVGYFDPFPGLGAANPLPTTSALLSQALNGAIASAAAASGATFVDVYPDFVGREALLTNITQPLVPLDPNSPPNYHPNAAGYQVIAGRLQAAAALDIPEPGTLVLIAGLMPLVGIVRRRRRAR